MATASILCRDSWQCSTRFCSSSHRMARRAQDFKSCHRLSQENGSQRCACVCLNLLLKINNYWNWGHPSTLRIIYIYIYLIQHHTSQYRHIFEKFLCVDVILTCLDSFLSVLVTPSTPNSGSLRSGTVLRTFMWYSTSTLGS